MIARMNDGTDLKTLTAAAALANARTFGGQDYIGFHTFMALAPAYEMARELPKEQAALPVLKVLYRNTNRIQAKGGARRRCCRPSSRSTRSKARTRPSRPRRERRRREGRTHPGEAASGLAGRGVQPSPVFRAGRHRRPPRRPRLAGVGVAGRRRQGTRPHAAAPVGALLRQHGDGHYKKSKHEPAIRACCRS